MKNKIVFLIVFILFSFIQPNENNDEEITIFDEYIFERDNDFRVKYSNENFRFNIKPDLTIVGFTNFNNGLGRISMGITNCYKNLNFNFIQTQKCLFDNLPLKTKKIIASNNGYYNPGKVILLTDVISWVGLKNYRHVPNSGIRMAYSMFETTKISKEWVQILNNKFDLVIVPDTFLVDVYKNSGVKIPIFVVALGIYINEFLNQPEKTFPNKPFVFGCSAAFNQRKNHKLLIEAFIKEFKNSRDVILKINGLPYGSNDMLAELQLMIKQNRASNIEITSIIMPWQEYIKFMSSLDCYVSLSKGEGFSIPPREAFALGIPSILTNNTAQKNLCKTGFARAVNSIPNEPANYPELFGNETLGFFHNCSITDVRKALRDVYDNYQSYLLKAYEGRKWIQQYTWRNMTKKYINLVKPKKIYLGNKNMITNDYLMTDSKNLFNKYKMVLKK